MEGPGSIDLSWVAELLLTPVARQKNPENHFSFGIHKWQLWNKDVGLQRCHKKRQINTSAIELPIATHSRYEGKGLQNIFALGLAMALFSALPVDACLPFMEVYFFKKSIKQHLKIKLLNGNNKQGIT